jgi:hypothetical protein
VLRIVQDRVALNRDAHGILTSKNRQLASMDAMYYIRGYGWPMQEEEAGEDGGRCSFEDSFAGLLFSQNTKVKIHNTMSSALLTAAIKH